MDADPFKDRLDQRAKERAAAEAEAQKTLQRRNNYAKHYAEGIASALERNACPEFSVQLTADQYNHYRIDMMFHGTIIGGWHEQQDGAYVFFSQGVSGTISMNSNVTMKRLYSLQDMIVCAADVVEYMRNRPK